jgi:hypothetical protein
MNTLNLKSQDFRPVSQFTYTTRDLIESLAAFEQDRVMQRQHPGVGERGYL